MGKGEDNRRGQGSHRDLQTRMEECGMNKYLNEIASTDIAGGVSGLLVVGDDTIVRQFIL